MANTFTYRNLPGYGTNLNYDMTDMQKNRMGYWTGEKQEKEWSLQKLYENKFQNLEQLKNNEFQLLAQQDATAKGLMNTVNQQFQTAMGGPFNKESKMNKPYTGPRKGWWSAPIDNIHNMPKEVVIPGKATIPVPQSKWIPSNMPVEQALADPTLAASGKVIDGQFFLKNPHWASKWGHWGNKLAKSGMGKLGAAGAGKFTTATGLLGAGISYFADDRDPTTYTGWEKAGDALSWGSLGWKVGAMVNPVLGVPLAIAGALISNKLGSDRVEKAKEKMKEHRIAWENKIKEFRKDQRNLSKIGGTSPINMNWWTPTYS